MKYCIMGREPGGREERLYQHGKLVEVDSLRQAKAIVESLQRLAKKSKGYAFDNWALRAEAMP